jgi:sugar lactone lactonase YvrE
MDNSEKERTGRFYLFQDGIISNCGLDPVCITNGPAITPDGRTLYAVDTLDRSIDALTISASGLLSERRRFVTLAPDEGYPDGVSCDALEFPGFGGHRIASC